MALKKQKSYFAGMTIQQALDKKVTGCLVDSNGEDITFASLGLPKEIPDLQTALANGWYAHPRDETEPDGAEDDESNTSSDAASCTYSSADEGWDFLIHQEDATDVSDKLRSTLRGVELGPVSVLASNLVRELLTNTLIAPQEAEATGTATDADNDISESVYDLMELDEMSRGIIWDTPAQRDDALKKHRNASRNHNSTPGIFDHGVRYIRYNDGGMADAANKIKCRTIMLVNLPDAIELGDILAQLRGERIIKAHLVQEHDGFGPRAAFIYFSKHEDAKANFDFYSKHGLAFRAADGKGKTYQAGIIMPDTNTYPLTDNMDIALQMHRTRHLEFEGTEPSSILRAMNRAGLGLADFGKMVTGLRTDDLLDTIELEFRSIAMACRVREEFIGLNRGTMAKVSFIKDSCNAAFEEHPSARHPIHPTGHLMEHFKRLMVEREAHEPCIRDDEHLRIVDPESKSWEAQGRIIAEDLKDESQDKTADWTGDHIERDEGQDNQGNRGIWEKDPISGARQFRAYLNSISGGVAPPVMYRADWVKEWLCYNLDSENPSTSHAIDAYFEAHGLINIRRVNTYVQDRGSDPGFPDRSGNPVGASPRAQVECQS